MDNNQRRFIEDALDLLNDLDEGLMQLELNPDATAPLEQVFRTMHTIKGGANMFGFEKIGSLAHNLETLFDLVRQRKIAVSENLISITLHAFDKVRSLFNTRDADEIAAGEALDPYHVEVLKYLQTVEVAGFADDQFQLAENKVVTWHVRVVPKISLTTDGTHPLVFIVQDVQAFGCSQVSCVRNEDSTVKHWDIVVATGVTADEILSLFLFSEEDCTVTCDKLAASNLLENEEFKNALASNVIADIALIKSLAEKIDTAHDHTDHKEKNIKGSADDVYIRVSKNKIDDLLNGISELLILQAQLLTATKKINSSSLTTLTEQLEMVTGRLRDTSLEIGLVPIETLVTRFKRLVRDLSKSLGKKVNFISEGTNTELDKDVIEVMGESLMHIIRNAIDHGIEDPETRKLAGKSEHGNVKLKAYNSNAYVHLVITDDGRGIPKDIVLKKAIEKGLVTENVSLSDEEIFSFIFHPGLSTASQISDVSGRGVGMDVVKQKINDLRGYVSVSSVEGKGTAIHIRLPLSRSIIEGLLVNVADTRYVVPLNVVERIDRIPYEDLSTNNKVNKTVVVNEENLQVFSLRKNFHPHAVPPRTSDIVSISVNGVRKGIAVDKIEGKMQTVMKPLGQAYQEQAFISGSTVLGDGTLALVLDPARLFQFSNNQNL